MSRILRLAILAFLNTSPGAGGSTPKGIPLSCLAFMQDNFLHSFRRHGSEVGAIHSVILSPGLSGGDRLKRMVGLNIFRLVINNDNGHIIVYRSTQHRDIC